MERGGPGARGQVEGLRAQYEIAEGLWVEPVAAEARGSTESPRAPIQGTSLFSLLVPEAAKWALLHLALWLYEGPLGWRGRRAQLSSTREQQTEAFR